MSLETGVGSLASQIARQVLGLSTVITIASRPEIQEFTKDMGAIHVINHQEDLKPQIDALKLDLPLKYIFITHRTDNHLRSPGMRGHSHS